MNRQFLLNLCENYFIENDIYSQFTKKQIPIIKENIINEILNLNKYLLEYDIETYDMLADRNKITQTRIINRYLDYCFKDDSDIQNEFQSLDKFNNLNVVNEIFTGVDLALFGTFLTVVFLHKPIGDLAFKILSKIGRFFEGLGKFFIDSGRFFKFKYAIIRENNELCYRNCKVDPDTLSGLAYTYGKSFQFAINAKELAQVQCLSKCYLDYVIECIHLLSKSYFICLRNTSQFKDFQDMKADDLMKVMSSLELGSTCKEYFDYIKESFDNFYSLVDHVFDKEKDKQEAIQRLRDRISNARSEVANSKDLKKMYTSNTLPKKDYFKNDNLNNQQSKTNNPNFNNQQPKLNNPNFKPNNSNFKHNN